MRINESLFLSNQSYTIRMLFSQYYGSAYYYDEDEENLAYSEENHVANLRGLYGKGINHVNELLTYS